MKLLAILFTACLITTGCSVSKKNIETDVADRKALEQTGIAIRSAFSKGDVETILSYHHPDVVKALGYTKYINGLKALKTDLMTTLQNNKLEFKENKTESLLIEGNTAVEMAAFTIEGNPKNGGKPFIFKGRAMVVYVRYKASPTGWASIREIIQPATE